MLTVRPYLMRFRVVGRIELALCPSVSVTDARIAPRRYYARGGRSEGMFGEALLRTLEKQLPLSENPLHTLASRDGVRLRERHVSVRK